MFSHSPSKCQIMYIKLIKIFWCILTDVKLKLTDLKSASKQFETGFQTAGVTHLTQL